MSNTLRLFVFFSLCFVFLNGGAQSTDWMFSTDENGTETATAVVRDHSQGCFYVSGYFEGTITHAVAVSGGVEFGYPMSFTSEGDQDVFVARLADNGELVWFKTFGSDEEDLALTIEVGADGLLYVGGFLQGIASISSSTGPSMQIGSNVSDEPRNPFIVAFNPNGDPVWNMSYGTPEDAAIVDIKADEDGLNVLTYHESQTFISPFYSLDSEHQYLLQNIDYSHELIWKTSFGAPSSSTDFENLDDQRPRMALFDHNLYIAGVYNTPGFNISGNTFTISTNTWDAVSNDNVFLTSFITGGGFNWVQPIQTASGNFRGFGLAAGCDGLYLSGAMRFSSGLQFPGMLVSGSNKREMFVAKFIAGSGQTVWVNVYESPQGNDDEVAMAIEVDNHGGVIVGGFTKQSIIVPGFPTLSGDNADGLVFGLDVNGNATWVLQLQGEDTDAVLDMDIVDAGELVVCGKNGQSFNGFIDSQVSDGENGFAAKISYPVTGTANCCLANDGGTIKSNDLSLCAGQPLIIHHDIMAENRTVQYSLLGFGWVNVQAVTSNPIVINNPLSGFYRVKTDFGDCGTANSNILSTNLTAAISLDCPADKAVSLTSGCSFAMPDYTNELILVGACPMDIVQTPAPGTTLTSGFYTVSFQGSIAGLPVVSCSFDLTLQDTSAPTMVCVPDITKAIANGCPYILENLTNLFATNDNCGLVTVTQSIAPGTSLNVGDYNITFEATDADGNSTSCTSVLHIVSGVNTFECPADQTRIATSTCSYTVEDFKTLLVLTGYCSGTTIVQTPTVGTPLTVGDHTISFQLTDAFGAVSNCSMGLSVIDDQPPVLSGIGVQTVQIVSGCTVAMPNYTSLIGVDESCGYTLTQTPAPGLHRSPGTYNVIVTCTDNSGNSATTSFAVEVVDQIDPILTYPSIVTVQADASCTLTIEDLTGYVSVTENCTSYSFNQFPFTGSIVGIGDTPIEIEVEDASGNATIANFILRVEPNAAWSVTCQPALVVNAPAGTCSTAVSLVAPEVEGLCVGYSISNDAPSMFPIGDSIVTWTITSDEGEEKTCQQLITVQDNQPPSIACPTEIVLFVISGCSRAIPNYTGIAAVTDCGAVTITQSPVAGTILPIGQHLISLTATDASGNSSICEFNLQIKDSNSPNITCLPNQNRIADSNCEYNVENFTSLVTIVDDCGASTVQQSPAVGTSLTAGVHLIHIYATDISGNTSQCTFSLTVVDTAAPGVTCQSNVDLSSDPGECFATHSLPQPTVEDFCGVLSVTDNEPAVYSIGTTAVTWTVTDLGGNVSTCTTNVHVADIEAPVFNCLNSQVITAASCNALLPDYITGLAVSDCQTTTIEQSPLPGEILSVGDHTVTITATDIDGNEATCSFIVSVIDQELPQITCVGDQLRDASALCSYMLEDFTVLASATDDCGVLSITQTPVSGTVLSVGTHLVSLVVTDNGGNVATCTFNVEVVDNIAPAVVCPPDLTLSADAGDCAAAANLVNPIATDACGIQSISNDAPAQFNIGANTVNWTIVDQNGNTTSCVQLVTVIDDQSPALDCLSDAQRSAGAECQYTLEDFTLISNATDNCGTVVLTQIPVVGTVLTTGQHTIQIVATDQAGNQTTCGFELEVIDDQAPSLSCIADQNREVNDACEYLLEDFTSLLVYSDNCGILAIDQSPIHGTVLFAGQHEVFIEVIDIHGNVTSCSFFIDVVDTTPPTVQCQSNIVVNTDAGLCISSFTPQAPLAESSCESFDVLHDAPTEFPIGTTTINWIVADEAGNQSTCTQLVTVQDVELPVLECIADQERSLGLDCMYELEDFSNIISVFENCGTPVLDQIPAAGSLLSVGDHLVEITATDESGNSATCSFIVHVSDTTAPIIECPTSLYQSNEACLAAIPDLLAVVAIAECSTYNFVQEPSIGTLISPGIYPITITVTDEMGLSNACQTQYEFQTTTVLDIVCNLPSDISVSSCSFEIPDYTNGIEILSSCGDVVFTQIPEAGTIVSESTANVSIQAIDGNGNTFACSQQIALNYFADISIILQNDTTLGVESNCEATIFFETPILVGGCGEVELVQTSGPSIGDMVGIGDYEIEFTATDEWGNMASDSFVITVADNESPTITCGTNISSCNPFVMPSSPIAQDNCEVATLELSESNIWQPGLAFADGVNEVVYIATDVSGNAASCTTLVQINLPAIPAWDMSINWCVGDEAIDLNSLVISDEGFSWSGDVVNEHIMDPSILGEGEHNITLTSFEGMCTADSTIVFTVGLRPTVSAGVDFEACGLNTVVNGMSSADSVLWTSGPFAMVLDANNLTAILESDEYQDEHFVLTGFGSYGCQASDTVTVTFVEPPSIPSFSQDQITLLLGQDLNTNFAFDGIGELSVSWLGGGSTPIDMIGNNIAVGGLEEGTYDMVLVSTNSPCHSEIDHLKIEVLSLSIPNGFSPNGDGFNDNFEITGLELYPNTQLQVFDRDGNLVYQAHNYDNSWNGVSLRGDELPAETYFMVVILPDGTTLESYLIIRRS